MGVKKLRREANLCKFAVFCNRKYLTKIILCLEKIKHKPMDFETMSKKLILREATLSH